MSTTVETTPLNEHGANEILITVSIFLTIALGLTITRLYVRKFVLRELGREDLFMVSATLLATVDIALIIAAINYSFENHSVHITTFQLSQISKWLLIFQKLWILGTLCSRISITLLLMRTLVTKRKWRITIWCFIAFMVSNYIAFFVQSFFVCTPMQALLSQGSIGNCSPSSIEPWISLYFRALGVVFDLTIALMPIVFLRNIRISRKSKIGVCCLMGLGLITGSFALVGTYEQFADQAIATDPTWNNVNVTIWTCLEMLLLIIGGNIPFVRPLFRSKQRARREAWIASHESHPIKNFQPIGGRHAYDKDEDEDALIAVPLQTLVPPTRQHIDKESGELLHSDRMGWD